MIVTHSPACPTPGESHCWFAVHYKNGVSYSLWPTTLATRLTALPQAEQSVFVPRMHVGGGSTQTPGLPLIGASQICCPVHFEVLAHGTGIHLRPADLQPCHRRCNPSWSRGRRWVEGRHRCRVCLRLELRRSVVPCTMKSSLSMY